MASPYKVVIFDFYDVIRTDGFKWWLKRNNLESRNEILAINRRMDCGEISIEQFMADIGRLVGRSAEMVDKEMDEDTQVNQEVVSLARQLKKNYKTALLSNSPSGYLRALLVEHDLEKHFDEIVISSEAGLIKPSPEIFHHTLARLGASPAETVFIDDNAENTRAASTLGIASIVYGGDPSRLKNDLASLGLKLD